MQLTTLQNKVQSQTTTLKRAFNAGKDTEPAQKRLRKTGEQISELESNLKGLQDRSSGRIPVPESISAGISSQVTDPVPKAAIGARFISESLLAVQMPPSVEPWS